MIIWNTLGRNAVAAASLAITACALAACSTAPAPAGQAVQPQTAPSSAHQPGVATDARACAVAPSATVGAALKLPVGGVIGTVEGPVTVCAYQGRYEVIVRFQRGETASEFTADERANGARHQQLTTVAGLGDSAYLATYAPARPPVNTLAVRRGTLAIYISSPAPLSTERTLMTQLLAKV